VCQGSLELQSCLFGGEERIDCGGGLKENPYQQVSDKIGLEKRWKSKLTDVSDTLLPLAEA